jgi:hypothetical protein
VHAFREVTNGSLSNAILEVCLYSTKGELLLRIMASCLKALSWNCLLLEW